MEEELQLFPGKVSLRKNCANAIGGHSRGGEEILVEEICEAGQEERR